MRTSNQPLLATSRPLGARVAFRRPQTGAPHANVSKENRLNGNQTNTTTPQDIFVTTKWTVVRAAGRRHTAEADAALAELCQTYWYPLYTYVRRHVGARADAGDLTQAFFARLIAKDFLAGLDRDRGRFRAFLLAALKHFLANDRDWAQALKRGGGATTFQVDWQDADARYRIEPVDNLSPDRLFDRAWAVTLLEKVVGRLRKECADEGRIATFEALKPFLAPADEPPAYAEVSRTLGVSETTARVAVHRLRRRYRALLRDEIAQTLASPDHIADEMHTLLGAFTD